MHTMSVRALARRTALAAAVAALATTPLVAPAPALLCRRPLSGGSRAARPPPPAGPPAPGRAPGRAPRGARGRAPRSAVPRPGAEAARRRRPRAPGSSAWPAGGRRPVRVRRGRPGRLRLLGLHPVRLRPGRDLAAALLVGSGGHRPAGQRPAPGDLVFFTGSGGVYHVAIYAGDGTVWHAPHSGAVVSQEPIWTSSVFYGRVG